MRQLGAAAVGTEDLGPVCQEATADQRDIAAVTDETFAVPVTVIERDELRTTQASDWLGTSAAFLGKQVSEAVGTIWFLIT